MNRLQKVAEHPLGHVPALFAGILVGEAEVNAFIDSGEHDIVSGIRETAIGPGLRDAGSGVGGPEREGNSVLAEKEIKSTGRGA